MSKVYGYAVVNNDNEPAPLNRKVYDTKNGAATGFYQWTKREYGMYSHPHLKGKKLSEQDEYRVIALVAQ